MSVQESAEVQASSNALSVGSGQEVKDGADLRDLESRSKGAFVLIFSPKMLLIGGALLVIGYLALTPLLYLLNGTFFGPDGLTLNAFRRAFSSTSFGSLTYNTLLYSLGATAVSTVVGTALAYLVVRTDLPFKKLVVATAIVPVIIPGILYTIAWIFLASGRIGILNTVFQPIFPGGLFEAYSMLGMIFIQGMDNSPLIFLLLYAGFKSMDPSLEESARMSGAGLLMIARRITLPLVKPSLYAAILIMLVRNISSFETPALLGMPEGILVYTSRIWRVLNRQPVDYAQAGAYSFVLLVITAVGVYLYSRLQKKSRSFQTVSGKGFRPTPMSLGKWRAPIAISVMAYFVISVVLPVLVLMYMSTQTYYAVPSRSSLARASLDNYVLIWNNPTIQRAWQNSLILAAGTATLTILLAAVAAWFVIKSQVRGRSAIDTVAFLPLVIPGLVLGVGLIFVYLRFPLPVYGTLWILLIAYITNALPYGMRYAGSAIQQIGNELEESASMCGASWAQIFRRILVPLMAPGLLAGWIYIVIISVRELSSSILLYSAGSEVLAVLIWDMFDGGRLPELAALGMVMIVLMTIVALLAQKLGANIGIQEGK